MKRSMIRIIEENVNAVRVRDGRSGPSHLLRREVRISKFHDSERFVFPPTVGHDRSTGDSGYPSQR